jgi:hypothetical protein
MDGWISDAWEGVKDAVSDAARAVKKVVISPTDQFISKLSRSVKTGVIHKIDSMAELRDFASKFITPQTYMLELYFQIPGFEKVDEFSGGTFSDARITLNIPGKVVRGEKITPYEMAVAIQTGIKLGAVAASGGSAGAIIGVVAGQLKKGTLGESEEGMKILTVAEIAGYAAAAGQSIGDIAADQAEKKAISYAEKQALEKTELGKSYLGQTLVQVGKSVYTDGQQGPINMASDYAKSKAIEKLPQGKYIVKYGPYIYEGLVDEDFTVTWPTTDDMMAKAQLEIAKSIQKLENYPGRLQEKLEKAARAKIMREVAELEGIIIEKLLGQGKTPQQIQKEIQRRQQSPTWQNYLKNRERIKFGVMIMAGGGTMALVAASLKKRKKRK